MVSLPKGPVQWGLFSSFSVSSVSANQYVSMSFFPQTPQSSAPFLLFFSILDGSSTTFSTSLSSSSSPSSSYSALPLLSLPLLVLGSSLLRSSSLILFSPGLKLSVIMSK